MVRTATTYLKIALLVGTLAGCDAVDPAAGIKCGCTPPPPEPVTLAQIVHTWQLEQITTNGQYINGTNIKDRYQMKFMADGRYAQMLLADSTTYAGTWKLTGDGNHTLHLTDHKGASQEYTINGVNSQRLLYGRGNKENKYDLYTFTLVVP